MNLLISVCIPTRGQIFTQVIDALAAQETFLRPHFFFTWDTPTPDAFTTLVHLAQESEGDTILFIEEDTVLPNKDSLHDMHMTLWSKEEIGAVMIEYPLIGDHSSIVHLADTSTILYGGLGCTMIKKHIFDAMQQPWFRADRQFVLEPEISRGWRVCDPQKQYGLYDIIFFTRMRALGYSIAQVSGQCRHLTLSKEHTPQQNGSMNVITDKATVCNRSAIAVDPLRWSTESDLL